MRAKSTKLAKCSDDEAIPKGSMLLGHVTQVQARGKVSSVVAIRSSGVAQFDNLRGEC